MPLVRVEVRNEYGLGMPELYTETNREDPKAVLDGVVVAGLVGILRQLGDLAEFAAEVFHGIQEQVLITSSRSHKLVQQVHNIEAALPPLEKAILAQRSHLHFAYTAGSHWHTRLRTEQNHFIYSDLPRFIMDSYEDCLDPPRLHKLDKFDIGGPGACFKRYSDPTYFKRASAGPNETHLQSVPREKKARRSKKKRSSKYRDATHGAPITTHGDRTDFGSSKFKDKTPPEPEIEPEIEDHLTSFDSRTGSGYIECIFRPSYSTQSEDNNAKEPSSDSNHQHNSYLDSASIDENTGVPDENTQNSYLPDHNGSRSSYITWDEKLEIIDSTSRPNDATEVSCTSTTHKVDTEEKEDLNTGDVNHTVFDFHDEPLPTFRGQPDEIESETDYYMDALNTIESESENDIDCQTKRELQQSSCLNNKNTEVKHETGRLDDNSMNFEFHVVPPESHMEAYKSSINENSEGDEVISPHVAGISSISFTSPDKFKSEEVESHNTNSQSPKPSSSTSGAHTTLSQPVTFWTNGGLLGLEPSKPPDFGLPTATGPGPGDETKNDLTKHSNQQNTIDDMVVNGSTPESSSKLPQEYDCNASMTPQIDGSVLKDKEDSVSSSRIFEFSNRLLVNGFRRQISLVGDERLASSVKSDIKERHTVTGKPFREQFGSEPPLKSPSPPLEHMRISFQPIDGFETSKLKLTFPDGNNNNNESNGHMFPSFQLVPEPAVSFHESGSDSDDDMFCRSSPYASDDCHSHPSESNSEQWDSNHELDDAFGRISSAESVSSSLVNGIRFQQGFDSMNGRLLDIPNYDSMNTSHNQVIGDSDGMEPTPPPPPLPPMEWRGIKPHPCVTEEKEDALSEALTYTLNLTPPEPTVPQQPKPAPLKPDHFGETVDHMLNKKQSHSQNLNAQNESNRTINGKVNDEKEDFLQQIRTKSRNLRRTSTTQLSVTPGGPTNVKVTAILQKANAIRQAVGSDDGEDDNWSDT